MTAAASSPTASAAFVPDDDELAVLREVVEAHAAFDRPAGSPGEKRSAELLADQLREAGARPRVEAATFYRGWPSALALATGLPALAALVNPRRRRGAIAALCAACGVLVADDIDNRTRMLRKLLRRRRPTTNVLAELGPADAPVTLVVIAHHDAGRTGRMFDQGLQQALWRRFPERIESMDASLPYWWPAVGAPIAIGAGILTGLRALRLGGAAFSAVACGLLLDIMRSPTVPGANDNLSAVAVLVALARRWRARPIEGIRVILLSAGAEEELQGGIHDWVRAHGAQLDPASTFCLAVDTVGSPQLVMLEGEGPVAMHDYTDPGFRDAVADAAASAGVPLERGLRSRFSTDAIVPSRAGLSTAALVSLAPWRAPSNYHLMTDTPDRLDYGSIAATVELTETLARQLADAHAT